MNFVTYLVLVLAISLVMAWVMPTWMYQLTWCLFFVGLAIFRFIIGDWPTGIFDTVFAALYFWLYWRNRPKGWWKRVRKQVGAKARALLEKVKASMPKAHAPALRPAFQPV